MQAKDTVLKQVQAAIGRQIPVDRQINAIGMDFGNGILTLDGEVPHVGFKKRALKAAAKVPQVTGIVDRLRVSAGDPPGDGATRDDVSKWLLRDIDFQNCALRMWVKGRLETVRGDTPNSSGSIEIAGTHGVVTLTGHVISLSHKRLAGVFAWWSRGCRDVVNDIEVIPHQEDNDDELTDALRLVLECDPYVHAEQIGIGCQGSVLTLSGTVSGQDERQRIERNAWYLFGVDDVINNIGIG
jgi:osmotically-inducible protein OsmY